MTTRASSAENTAATEPNAATAPAAADTGQVAAPDANTQAPDPAAASPSAADETKDAKKEPTLAEVIKTAATLDAEGKPSVPAKDGSKTEGEKPAAEAKAAAEEAKPEVEDDSKLPFHNHPRWKTVLGERDALKTRVAEFEPDATQYRKVTSFMDTHALTPDEVSQGFILMALMKAGDPRALVELDRYRTNIATAIGEVLTDDLKAQVESGAITEDAAKEISRSRAAQRRSDATATALRTKDTKRETDEAAARVLTEAQDATNEWMTKTAAKDPDFAKKEPAIERYAKALIHSRGLPKNKAEALKLVEDAYAEVNKTFAAFVPAKTPSTPVPNANSSISAKPVPKTLSEVIRAAAAA